MPANKTESAASAQIIVTMNRIMTRHGREMSRQLSPLGINVRSARLLARIHGAESRRCRELARACALDAVTLSHALKKLDQPGFVTRKRIGDDARAIEVRLTAPGKQLAQRCHDIEHSFESALLDALPPQALAHVTKWLAQIDRAQF